MSAGDVGTEFDCSHPDCLARKPVDLLIVEIGLRAYGQTIDCLILRQTGADDAEIRRWATNKLRSQLNLPSVKRPS